MDRYLARVCWNSKGWVRPTGEAAESENRTYATRMGFGHEEWLFNLEWVLDGWKYGFLQPVGRSRPKLEGKTIDVRLYTCSPESEWFYVGHLKSCEVLTEKLATSARSEFKKRGWFQDMLAQLKQVDADPAGLKSEAASWVFNIRFRPDDAVLYDPMVPIEESDRVRAFRRYSLVQLAGQAGKTIEQQWATRVGTTELRGTGKQVRSAVPPREVDLAHNQLQNDLFDALVKKYGKTAVEMEAGFADIRIRRGSNRVTLVEVKSDSRPRFAIREALGQLLEYAFVAEKEGAIVDELVVAAPGEAKGTDLQYIDHLRATRKLPLRYVCVRRGLSTIDL